AHVDGERGIERICPGREAVDPEPIEARQRPCEGGHEGAHGTSGRPGRVGDEHATGPSIDSERGVPPDACGRLRGDARAKGQAAVQGCAETADQNIVAEAAAAVDRAGDENDRWPPPCDVDGASRSDAHARSPAAVVRMPDQYRRRPGSTIIVAVA